MRLSGFVGCLALHALTAMVMPSAWWVPNITLVAMSVAITARPRAWFPMGLAAGWFMTAWAVRHTTTLLIGYLILAGAIAWLAQRWELTEPRTQRRVVAAGAGAMTCWLLWLDHLWSLPVLGWSILHVAATTLIVPLLQYWWRYRPRQRHGAGVGFGVG